MSEPVARIVTGMGPPPHDTRSQREATPRECDQGAANDRAVLLCWRLLGHPGLHYDEVDGVWWTTDPVADVVPIRG